MVRTSTLISIALLFCVAACGSDTKQSNGISVDTDAGNSASDAQTNAQTNDDPGREDPPPIGGPCDDSSGCDNGTCAIDAPGGYCTAYCDAEPCPDGSTCFDVGDDLSICYDDCETDADCRNNYYCDVDGSCIPDPVPIGEACSSNADCLGGVCITELEGGYCSLQCDAQLPCPIGSTCIETEAASGSLCLEDCVETADCRAGYVCNSDGVCLSEDETQIECTCSFKQCGDDGCGNSCGTCNSTVSTCTGNTCVCNDPETVFDIDTSAVDIRNISPTVLSGDVRWTLSHDSGGIGQGFSLRSNHLGKCSVEATGQQTCVRDGEVTFTKTYTQQCFDTGEIIVRALYFDATGAVSCEKTFPVNEGTIAIPQPIDGGGSCTFPETL